MFETFDVTRGLGYSRRPFYLAVGVDFQGVLKGVKLLQSREINKTLVLFITPDRGLAGALDCNLTKPEGKYISKRVWR